jgi:hypothetical protein
MCKIGTGTKEIVIKVQVVLQIGESIVVSGVMCLPKASAV